MASDSLQRTSDHLVRLVQVVFGLVVAQSLALYIPLITHPFAYRHRTAVVALAAVYLTTVWSWVDWHMTMEANPYDIRRPGDRWRLGSDLLVVIFYAYLLFAISEFAATPNGDIWRYLLGYPLVFAFYFLSGVLRRLTNGPMATNLLPIVAAWVASVVLLLIYRHAYGGWRRSQVLGNIAAIAAMLAIMYAYRLGRRWYRRKRLEKKRAGSRIGVDLDGVLGNQVVGVLPTITATYGIPLRYDDVTEWRLPVANTDIGSLIEEALTDDTYIEKMPVHRGSSQTIGRLFKRNIIVIVTARPVDTMQGTRRWLLENRLWFDELTPSKEARKSRHRLDILVDDYLGNVHEFLCTTQGMAVLVDKPWNRGRIEIARFIENGRLRIVPNVRDVPDAVRILVSSSNRERRKRHIDWE